MELRGTQPEFVRKGIEILTSKSTSKTVLVAPVAYGKSICIAQIVAGLDGPCIVLQPNKELLEQNHGKFESYGFKAAIYSASAGRKELDTITYATIKSIKSQVELVRKLKVKYLILDECHMATKRNSEIDKFVKALKIKNVLGVTATPVLLESSMGGMCLKMMDKSSKNMFSTLGHVVQIQEMVELGYWSKLKYDIRVVDMDGLELNSSGSEFDKASMRKAYDANDTEKLCIKAVADAKKLGRKSILVFVPDVASAKSLSEKIVGSEYVHGGTAKKRRKEIVDKFKALDIQVLINVEVFTTGFDHPQLDAIIMARPTASIALYYQILGRGTRIHPEKEYTLIIDLSGNVSNFGGVERLYYEYIDGYGWGLFSDDICLTHGPISSKNRPTLVDIKKSINVGGMKNLHSIGLLRIPFGKYINQPLKVVPDYYKKYMLKEWTFSGRKMEELQRAIKLTMQIE